MPISYVFFQLKYRDACEEESISDNNCLTVEEALHDIEDGTLVFLR
jgi:regulator of sigma D